MEDDLKLPTSDFWNYWHEALHPIYLVLGDQTQGFKNTRQAVYRLSYIPGPPW